MKPLFLAVFSADDHTRRKARQWCSSIRLHMLPGRAKRACAKALRHCNNIWPVLASADRGSGDSAPEFRQLMDLGHTLNFIGSSTCGTEVKTNS